MLHEWWIHALGIPLRWEVEGDRSPVESSRCATFCAIAVVKLELWPALGKEKEELTICRVVNAGYTYEVVIAYLPIVWNHHTILCTYFRSRKALQVLNGPSVRVNTVL